MSIGQLITQTAMILIIRQPFRVYIQFIYNYDHPSHKDETSNCMSNSFNWQSLIYIHPSIERPWNEALSSKIAEVQDSFKNIPSMLYFSPSSVNFNGIGVYAAEILPKGMRVVLFKPFMVYFKHFVV